MIPLSSCLPFPCASRSDKGRWGRVRTGTQVAFSPQNPSLGARTPSCSIPVEAGGEGGSRVHQTWNRRLHPSPSPPTGGKRMFNPRFLRLGGLRRFGGYPTNRSRFWPWCLGLKSPLPHIPSRRHAQETQWKRLKDVFGAVAEISRGKFLLESQATSHSLPPSLLSPLSPRCCRRWP